MTSPETDDATVLLQSVVGVARAIFGAAASSVFLLDREANELIFMAVAGQGEQSLVGTRFPGDRGIAGWVAMSGDAMVVDDLSANNSFARDLAESTEYVPNSLMAAPLIDAGGEVLGVLEVLDPVPQSRSDLAELDLLLLFAAQAATALRMVLAQRARQASEVAALDAVAQLSPSERASGLQLLDAMRTLLAS